MAQTDLEIARAATLRPIEDIAARLGLAPAALYRVGPHIAKVDLDAIAAPEAQSAKLVLVTAMTPTPAGEGKTTTTVGLGDAFSRIGRKTAICLREPSLGPCFGVKGGAAGGGLAQVVPMEDINLHFTGDFHAIAAANNLLAAMLDNHMYWGNAEGIDSRRIHWRRCVDMNDRALRRTVINLGGVANGFPREDATDIAVASEVMAIFCLAEHLSDLQNRLGKIVVAERRDRTPVTAADLNAAGAMAALLKEALRPNLVQTLEGTPAFVHGGPFANIAHGCNSAIATRAALSLADVVVTEAGFGADLGAEKFFDIKCRKAGLTPHAAAIVATVRALKMHGGVARDALAEENLGALEKGFANLARHVDNVRRFGVPAVVGINRFVTDTEAELALVQDRCRAHGVEAIVCSHWADGGAGAEELAHHVAGLIDTEHALNGLGFRPLYPDDMHLWDKVETIATRLYGASEIIADKRIRDRFRALEDQGYGRYPVCIAKTQYSFSTDPNLKGAPTGHVVPIRDVRLANGAEFVVVICGDIMTMPGLPRKPAAEGIYVDDQGRIEGLF